MPSAARLLLCLLCTAFACGPSVPAQIIPLDDRVVPVGGLLEVVVRGTVPGTISLEKPAPTGASLVPLAGSTATTMMRWIPLASDVGPKTLTFALESGRDRITESMLVTVVPSEIGRPQFLGTPYNAILDKAVASSVTIRIAVKDDDDTSILLDVLPGTELENGQLPELDKSLDGKMALYTFTPSAEQLKRSCSFGTQLRAKDQNGMEARAGVFIEVRNGCQAEPPLLINEVFYDPQSNSDANGDKSLSAREDEFVEIVNISDRPIEISGATISDEEKARFTFPSSTTLMPRQSAVVFGGGTPTGFPADVKVFAIKEGGFGAQGLSLNNDRDGVYLRSSDGSLIDSVSYPGACVSCSDKSNTSIVRLTELSRSTRFIEHNTAKGALGRYSPGRRVDGKAF